MSQRIKILTENTAGPLNSPVCCFTAWVLPRNHPHSAATLQPLPPPWCHNSVRPQEACLPGSGLACTVCAGNRKRGSRVCMCAYVRTKALFTVVGTQRSYGEFTEEGPRSRWGRGPELSTGDPGRQEESWEYHSQLKGSPREELGSEWHTSSRQQPGWVSVMQSCRQSWCYGEL